MKIKQWVVLGAMLATLSFTTIGCDRTVSKTEDVKTSSDGTVKTKEKTVTESPDGTQKTEEKKTQEKP